MAMATKLRQLVLLAVPPRVTRNPSTRVMGQGLPLQ
jgi:hypothetical protein